MMKDIMKEYDVSFTCLLETHVAGAKAEQIVRRLGLDAHYIQDAVGHSGRIWCCWDPSNWTITVPRSSMQCVHMRVQWHTSNPWLLTVVYGSPQQSRRHILWQELREIASFVHREWSIIRDFNTILHPHEKRGGAPFSNNYRAANAFNSCLQDCGVFDAGFQGYLFTWKKGSVEERLDRMVTNMEWRTRFSEAVVHHLPMYKPDHHPLLVKFSHPHTPNRRRRPFRFEAAWMTHEMFPPFLSQNWRPHADWNSQMKSFQDAVKDWNKNTFGNIFAQKRKLLRRLHGISRVLGRGPNDFLEQLQKELWEEYEEILVREELL